MVVRQNSLSSVMLKNDKLSNDRLHLATPEICQAYQEIYLALIVVLLSGVFFKYY